MRSSRGVNMRAARCDAGHAAGKDGRGKISAHRAEAAAQLGLLLPQPLHVPLRRLKPRLHLRQRPDLPRISEDRITHSVINMKDKLL